MVPVAPAIPTPAASSTPTPAPTSTPSPLTLSCQASPRSGDAPLAVKFKAFPGGGTGSYDFLWQFGDGERSFAVHPTHTYFSSGAHEASVTVSSGEQVVHCRKLITVSGTAAAPGGPNPPSLPDVVITITGINGGMSFSPAVATARVGQRVVWRNADVIIHTATADAGAFDTGVVSPGANSGIKVGTTGTFPYHCAIHPVMTGTLTIVP
jgi:plastocyanin